MSGEHIVGPLKIGEVAKRAGVSVRTLHYYEEIGLVVPTGRTPAGHRLYGREAIQRLQQIKSLQHLGLSLSEVDALIRGQAISPRRIVTDHLARVRGQLEALAHLETQLERLEAMLERGATSDAEAVEMFLNTMEAMKMYEKYLDQDQLDQVNEMHADAGEAAGAESSASLAAIRAEMEAGTPPDDAKVKPLIDRWHKAAEPFMPKGDDALHKGVMDALHEESQALEDHGLDAELFAYIGRAIDPDAHA